MRRGIYDWNSPLPPKSARTLSHFSSTAKDFQPSISEDGNRFVFSFGEKRNLKLVSRVELTHQPFKDTLCFPKRLPCHIQTGSEEGNCASPPRFFFPTGGLRMLDAYRLLPQGPGGRSESDIVSKHGFTDNLCPSSIILLQPSVH